MDTMTSTATKAVSGTKLAIATFAMFAAGSIALATVPASTFWSGCVDYDANSTFDQNQLFVKSTTTYNGGAKVDYCYTFPTTKKTYLMEGVSKNGNFSTWQKNCAELNAGKPGNNYQCVNGACVNNSVVATTLSTKLLNNEDNYNKNGILLAGTSAWIGKIELKAGGENIKVKDLKLTNVDTSGVDDDLAEVCLYRNPDSSLALNEISCQPVDSNGVVFFDDINEVITQGTKYWYVLVTANEMGTTAGSLADSGEVISFKISQVLADGVVSGSPVTILTDNTYTKQLIIAGTNIFSFQYVSSYGGYSVDTGLYGTGEHTVAILAISTNISFNTGIDGYPLKTQLQGIKFDVSKFASNTLSAVTIQKIGGIDPAGKLEMTNLNNASNSGVAYSNNLSSVLANDSKLESDTTSYFVVKATLDNFANYIGAINYLQFNMLDLAGSTFPAVDIDNSLDWSDGFNTFHGPVSYLTQIYGTKLVGNNY